MLTVYSDGKKIRIANKNGSFFCIPVDPCELIVYLVILLSSQFKEHRRAKYETLCESLSLATCILECQYCLLKKILAHMHLFLLQACKRALALNLQGLIGTQTG